MIFWEFFLSYSCSNAIPAIFNMNSCHIDHLVITAFSLQEGVDYVHQKLVVTMQQGGEHTAMGTHNNILKLGYVRCR